jgi:hypothetical protein
LGIGSDQLIVEEGLSKVVLTQTQGCEPTIVIPNGYQATVKELSINATLMIVMGLVLGFEAVTTDGAAARAEAGFQVPESRERWKRTQRAAGRWWCSPDPEGTHLFFWTDRLRQVDHDL